MYHTYGHPFSCPHKWFKCNEHSTSSKFTNNSKLKKTTKNKPPLKLWPCGGTKMHIYTLGHKNMPLFFNITPVFLGGFLHLMRQWKQKWIPQSGIKFSNSLTVFSIVAMVSAVQNDCGRWLPAVRSIEPVRIFHRKSSNDCFSFNFC